MIIDEVISIEVNDTKQWLLLRGEDKSKPIVLFVHGGPGSPLMYFSRGFDSPFLKDFVVVHWDQRGSGKSFDPNVPSENYFFDQYVEDGLKVTNFLREKFAQENIILVGHSWGTMVASNMVFRNPHLYRSYISVGTVYDMRRTEHYRYEVVKNAIIQADDKEAIRKINDLLPPFSTFNALEKFGDLLNSFIGMKGTFGKLEIEQVNDAVMMNREYSESEMVASMNGMRIIYDKLAEFLGSYNAYLAVPTIKIPIYFFQGNLDFNTPTFLAREYFEKLEAPQGKRWIEVYGAAHFPMYEKPDEFLKILMACRLGKFTTWA